ADGNRGRHIRAGGAERPYFFCPTRDGFETRPLHPPGRQAGRPLPPHRSARRRASEMGDQFRPGGCRGIPCDPDGHESERAAVVRTEQAARATAERALADALATIQRLRTQLAHAEMSHAEALDAERKHREALDQALLEAADTRGNLEKQLADDASTGRQDVKALPTRAEPCPVPEQHERRGTRPNAAREPEPVKWWLPSYKAQ